MSRSSGGSPWRAPRAQPPGVPHALDGVGRARFLNVHAPSYGFADYLRQLDSGDAFDATVYDVYEV